MAHLKYGKLYVMLKHNNNQFPDMHDYFKALFYNLSYLSNYVGNADLFF